MEDPASLPASLARARDRFAGPLLFGLMLAALAVFAFQMALTLPAKTDLSFPEGAVAARVLAVARGGGAYADWRQWPHQFAPYGPLLYYPAGWLARAWPGTPQAEDAYQGARLLTLLSVFGIAVLAVALGRRLGLRRAWPWLAAGLMLHWTSMLMYVQSSRPDAPEAFASFAALWIAAGGPPNRRRIAAALACLSLSMWVKPTAWGETLALALWAARSLGALRTAALFLGWGGANLLAAWALDRHWGGLLFLNMIGSLDNGWTADSVRGFLIGQGRTPYMLSMWGASAVAAGSLRGETHPARRLVFQAQLAAMAACLMQLFKCGADKNYFLSPFALSCVVLADGLERLWSGKTSLRPAMREFALWAGAIPYAALQLTAFACIAPRAVASSARSWRATAEESALQRRPGPMLTTYPHLAVTGSSPDTILDYIQYAILAERGRLDPGGLLERMRKGEIAWIALPAEDALPAEQGRPKRTLYCAAFWPTLFGYYEKSEEALDFWIYTPKGSAVRKGASNGGSPPVSPSR